MSVLERLITASRPVAFEIDGCPVHIRVLTGRERDQWEQFVSDAQGDAKASMSGVYARLVCLALANEDGSRACADADADALVTRISFKVLRDLFQKAMDVNRLAPEAVDAEKKDSPAVPTPSPG